MTRELLRAIAHRLQITRPLACVDLETTGVALGIDRTIQIAVMKVYPLRDGETSPLVTEWSSFIDPQVPIPVGPAFKHKITNEAVTGAPTFHDLAPILAGGLSGCDFVGQNVRFDLRFLEAEFLRVGRIWSWADAAVIDTKRIDELERPRTLEALVREWRGEEISDAHEALSDVRWAIAVLTAMLERCPHLPSSVRDLHEHLWPRDPSWLDGTGRIIWRNQEACLSFGKWNGRPLQQVPEDYLQWMLEGSFDPDVKAIVRDALGGKFPVRALTPQEAAA
jgi:DNA polymerase-3 subunit epsilon